MKETIGTILRLLLKSGGGFIVAKGIADEGTVETIIGAVLAIFGAIWGLLEAKKAAQLRQNTTNPAESVAPPVSLWLLCGFMSFGLMGCSTPQKPPTPAEQKYFTIETNVVERVVTVTNIVPATATTTAAVRVEPVTKRVEEYTFTPNSQAQLTATTSAAVTSIWNPVAGGVVGAAIMGLFSLWGLFRSKSAAANQAEVNQITAEELAQIIETGRQVLLKLPDGAQYEAAYKAWMIKHQAQTGILAQVAELLAASVDNDKAKGAAQTIVNLIQTQPKS